MSRNLFCIFEEIATKQPSFVAVETEDRKFSVSYTELLRRCELLACAISDIMVKSRGKFSGTICVITNRGIGMVVAILASLKANCCYVPIDPNFPTSRQEYILSHSQADFVIYDKDAVSSMSKLIDDSTCFIEIDQNTGFIVNTGKEHAKIKNSTSEWHLNAESNLAYILYTSGSTGKPKGVQITQKSVINLLSWFSTELQISSESIILGLTTYCFDISVLEIFLPLLYGGRLVLAYSSTQRDPFRLIEITDMFKITLMQATPTTYEMMLATGKWTGDRRIDLLV